MDSINKTNEELYGLLNSTGVGICEIDMQGNLTFCNQVAMKMFGFAFFDDLKGHTMHELIQPSDKNGNPIPINDCKIFQTLTAGTEKYSDDEVLWSLNGSNIPVEYWSYPVYKNNEMQGAVLTFHDITVRKEVLRKLKQKEDALRKQNALINTILDSIPHTIFFKGLNGNYIGCNVPFCEFVGKSKAEIIGKSQYDLFAKETADLFWEEDLRIMKTRQSSRYAEWITYPDGRRSLIDTLKTPYCGTDGELIGILGISHDITAAKKTEDELRKLSLAVEQSPVSIVITNPEGNIEYANPKALETSGYSLEELKGQNPRLLKSGETSTTDYKELWDTLLSGGKWNGVFHNKKKDGSLYYEYASISPIQGPDGRSVHYLAVKEDITERKQSEMALKESEDKYRNLVENISDVIYEINQTGIITYVSPSAIKIFGFTPEEMIGKSITVFIKDDETLLAERYSKLVTSEDVKNEHEAVTKSGETRYILISTKAVFDKGIFAGGSGTMVDITEKKLIELKLRENEALLRELNKTKDKFFSIIAHDLRTPFNAIIGLSDLLLMQIQSKDYEGIEEYAEIIQNSSQQAMNLLMNLLEWSRSQTGRLVIKPVEVDLSQLIIGIINLLNNSAIQKEITIIKKLPITAIVIADKEMIATVIRNIISNAIKFTKQEGTITVSVEQKEDELIVAVEDNGIGIRKENLDKLFRIDESTSTVGTQNEKGTGLGLMLCKEFIAKHGGKIWVESELGKGSVFTFSIPTVLKQ
jgi:PAS domain S-box-containing protein